MFTPEEQRSIRKRIDAIIQAIDDVNNKQVKNLEGEYIQLLRLPDSASPTKREKAFYEELNGIEGQINYLKGRWKILRINLNKDQAGFEPHSL